MKSYKEYKVLNTLHLGLNTSIIIQGNSQSFKNNTFIKNENNKVYKVLSVGMTAGAHNIQK